MVDETGVLAAVKQFLEEHSFFFEGNEVRWGGSCPNIRVSFGTATGGEVYAQVTLIKDGPLSALIPGQFRRGPRWSVTYRVEVWTVDGVVHSAPRFYFDAGETCTSEEAFRILRIPDSDVWSINSLLREKASGLLCVA